MLQSTVRILVVDDYEPWRQFVSSTLQKQPNLHVIAEASDGLQGVQKAQELKPDLVLLDIGLPKLNGIEAARKIRELVPGSKILVLSENRVWEIAETLFSMGVSGYAIKSEAAHELLPAVNVVLESRRFVSKRLLAPGLDASTFSACNTIAAPLPAPSLSTAGHDVGFYSDDQCFLNDVTRYIANALSAGNPAVVVATPSHRQGILLRLRALGPEIGAAIEQGRYTALDAADAVSSFMLEGKLDPFRFVKLWTDLIAAIEERWQGRLPHIAIFGECGDILCAQGNPEAALQDEGLCNQLVKTYGITILCGYSQSNFEEYGMANPAFQQICAAHSAVCSR